MSTIHSRSSVANLMQYKKQERKPEQDVLGSSSSAKYTPLTKIVSTLGPATESEESISKIIKAGVNVIRMNFSHGEYDFHAKVYKTVRKVAKDLGKEVAVLCDLQGPKVRCGNFKDGKITLKRGETVRIQGSKALGEPGLITTSFLPLVERCKVGETILIDDGLIRLTVAEKKANELICKIIQGGDVKNHKGINLPETDLGPLPALTEKDIADAQFCLKNLDNDIFGLSFVRKPQDVLDLRKIIKAAGKDVKICAKIEKPEAIRNLDQILAVVDSVMVARGDLAVEVGVQKVPILQKHIINHAREFGIPVITATQMLESMTNNPTPTRAEASDVANAIFDGSDAVMTSGETAVGEFPSETIQMMQQIILETEFYLHDKRDEHLARIFDGHKQKDSAGRTTGFTVALAAHVLANQVDATAFGVLSGTGKSAIRLATSRPSIPIYVFATEIRTVRWMCLTRGAVGILLPSVPPAEEVFGEMETRLKRLGAVKTGDTLVYTAGLPTLESAAANTVHVKQVD